MHQELLTAICKNDCKRFLSLINKKGTHMPININYKSLDNWCPIHFAAMHGSVDIMKLLLKEKSLKINARTNLGWNALHVAANSNKKYICVLLMESKIEINEQDQDLNSPLHYAT